MTIAHHLDPTTLMSFAAGSLAPAVAAVAAQHIALCAQCRAELAIAERIGRGLLQAVPPQALREPDRRPSTFAGQSAGQSVDEARRGGPPTPPPVAQLASTLADLDRAPWRWIGPGLWHVKLDPGGTGSLHLLKAAPGASVPVHDHGGDELTLVLRGALIEDGIRYGAGDVTDHDEEACSHQPAADAREGCICVIGSENKAQFHGWLARLMQPYHGM